MTYVTRARVNALLLSALLVLAPTILEAQLSPGKLHKAHTELEGVENCSKCHDSNRKMVEEKCLACHVVLQGRIARKQGLHSRDELHECQQCHIEHQGRDYNLIFWEKGEDNFDHAQTGYKLEGKHAGLKCRKCHEPSHIVIMSDLEKNRIDPTHTFLGLDTACIRCHKDEHRGQVSQVCTDCHAVTGWKPAAGFDHSRTKFLLTGKHLTTLCEKCHRQIPVPDSASAKPMVQFTGIPHGQCTDCHKDIHLGKLGALCTTCHTTESWKLANESGFDHSKTHYPLQGKHARVQCQKCHLPGQPVAGLKYAACTDCHGDFHKGAFAKRARKGACEECHTVDGYRPARFTVDQHNQTKYPLAGAHLAVSCNDCHREKKNADSSGSKTIRFTFNSTRCQACHGDPHKGDLAKYVTSDGCELCHVVASWHTVAFDHAKTKFPLEGKHAAVLCRSCHNDTVTVAAPLDLRFAKLAMACNDCHKDVHERQFSALVAIKGDPTKTSCNRCHTPKSWKAELFDHNSASSFKLEGAHRKVLCAGCHKKVTQGTVAFVRYKPLPAACSACHTDADIEQRMEHR